ncbi:Sterol carrier protein domain containing protein [Actinobacteria bacterium OK074]|nr:Sterol carrier protein domain containing protein [Actinobacteria bacterium OK074]
MTTATGTAPPSDLPHAPRALRPEEWDGWYDNLLRAFGGLEEPVEERQLWRDLTEFDRSIGVWDGGACVATSGAFSFGVTAPGGATVAAAGITMVGVAATHRRRGVLRSMMRRLLDDSHARQEPLSVLTASEPEIYGRFGYGIATRQLAAEIDLGRVRLSAPTGTDDVRVRYADPRAALDTCEALYARLVPARPGMLARRPGWERLMVLDTERARDGGSALQCVLAERDGETVGYATFRTKAQWSPAGHDGTVTVRDLYGVDPAARAALWRFLFGIDLMSALHVRGRPLDEDWQHQVSDLRRCRPQLREGLYARLVDVGAALEARAYQAPVDVVLAVEDAFCPWNTGRWRLTGDSKGAVCARTPERADLSLSVRELGSAYLGGVSLAALAAAGRVREERQGALAEAAVAFGWPVAPWLPHGF